MPSMRTRLIAAMTAVLLAAPFLSAAAQASPLDRKCDSARTEHKCEDGKR
jgi:hypothetical protein